MVRDVTMKPPSVADAAALPSAEVASALGVTPGAGLDPEEVGRRAAEAGVNELRAVERESVLGMLRDAATEPFVLMLALAGVLAVLVGEVRDGLLVLAGLLPIVGADVVTEFRGERALEALRAASAPVARVRRGGAVAEIPAAGLVPGDVVLLRAGDVLPADLRLVRTEGILVDRSVLTGESVPEPGRIEPDAPGAGVADRHSVAYSGTSVVSGRGEGIVVAIGEGTEIGRIAAGLSGRPERRSPVQRELDRLVRILLVVAIGLISITTIAGFLRGAGPGETLIAGISAAIAAIPEEPPVLLAVVLGLGAYRLLKRGVLVRRLNAEETLGAVDLILTDKTGTLTQNRLEVASLRTLTGTLEEPGARRLVLADALRAEADSWVSVGGGATGSFARSIARAADAAGVPSSPDPAHLEEAWPAADGTPYSRVIFRDGDRGTRELALGAPETVLALDAAVSPATVAAWGHVVDAAAAAGERLLLLSERDAPGGWVPRALLGFADTLRPGTRDALGLARDAGIQTLVVTGDHPLTAAAIARAAGIARDRVVTGEELATWDDERLTRELPGLDVVARALPEQKLRLVRAARAAGRTVAVTGDGVNDAPALQNADVAVAMGSGTAVAKEAADLVLGDDSFDTLMFALREGRRIVANVQKGLVFLISTHVAFLGFILLQTLSGASLPLLPIQILWMELFIDSATAVAFERESEEPGAMTRPPRPRARPLLTNGILVRIAVAGGFSAAAALVLAGVVGGDPEHGRWLAYTALVVGQVVRAYANRSISVPVWRLPSNGFLLAAGVLAVAVQAAIPVVPALADAFRATPLDAGDWALVLGVALAPSVVAHALRVTGRVAVA
jgi:Ca2+-transporting ATPase